jgi:hypothetical protein
LNRYLFFISQPYSLAVLRPLQAEIRKRGDEAAWYFDGPGAGYLRPDEIRLCSIDDVMAYEARAVFVPGNRVFDFFPGVKVEIFHGFSVNKRSENRGHFKIRGLFDLYCTQGPATTVPFQKLAEQHQYFKVKETGWPKMDPLFDGSVHTPPNARPVVLYTSTFTRKLTSAPHLFETIQTLSRKSQWQWLVTFHPRLDRRIVNWYKSIENNNLEFVETDDVIPLLKRADVMVSDTSSIASEFLLLEKPVVTFRNRKPGRHLIDIYRPEALENAIFQALERPQLLMYAISKYNQEIHPYRDGKSSARVLDATEHFIENEYPSMPEKPMNFFRKWKMRRRVGYKPGDSGSAVCAGGKYR